MANFSTNEFRSGLKVMLDGDPCTIVDNEFVKPGKGQAFNRVRLRNLKTGRQWERTFKSGETLEGADVMDHSMEYLYTDGEFWYFMEPDTFEQHQADAAAVGDAHLWLKEQDRNHWPVQLKGQMQLHCRQKILPMKKLFWKVRPYRLQ